ncbi:bifunctional NMN adenylyltransferase/Nudix hydrolase [Bacteroidaceae bacterium]|jgi:NADH pyrophosphatase NudC (nudix superfamily)|uniref:NUDIX domain-containing protein n=1 Tax=Prevotella sp. MGM2 TaxID=2033406 RepID=UPI000CEA0BCF|nr:NUDIX domain-containing protein [Prevotella sp. MGM2]GAY31403.1 Hydrolase, NUDIX family [Prevotella sp. MGM2]GFI34382.1 bifunctional NMN adenylyltransferase/Nudix hydrolase [Bacteroidaceae bacterium]
MNHPLRLFRYCPRCGSTRFGSHDSRSKCCADCGFTYYHNASTATVAVIFDSHGRLLVTRRAFDPARGTLDLPGGFVDPGESVEEGLRREVREETGGEVAEAAYLFSLPNIYLFSGMEVHTADMFFRCRLTDENAVNAADDAAELLWLPREEVCPTLFGLDSIRRGVERLTNVEE